MRGRARLVFSVVTVGGICAAFVAPSASFPFAPNRPKGPVSSGLSTRLTRTSRLANGGRSRSRPTNPAGLPQVTLIDFVVPANPPPTVPVEAPPVAAAPPTTAAAPIATATPTPTPRVRSSSVRAPGSSPGGAWACIRSKESGGNYATNTGNGYYGAYQFSLATWRSVGGTGLPSQASPGTQDALARKLQQRSGWGQWSTHSRCGV
jgi:Transglycosylase-like domain